MRDFQEIAYGFSGYREVIPEQLLLISNYLEYQTASEYLVRLLEEINWQSEQITLYGKTHQVPRLMAWHGDKGASYRYSNVDHQPLPWTETLLSLKSGLVNLLQVDFNSVLLNLYRNGRDSMGWHSDDEPELGLKPVIASISLGQERKLRFRKKNNSGETFDLSLPHGSVLLMYGDCQHVWQHHLPKTAKTIEPRINLTFRKIAVKQS